MQQKITPNLSIHRGKPAVDADEPSNSNSTVITVVVDIFLGRSRPRCSGLKDKYGLSWPVVPTGMEELLNDPDPERARRAMQAVLGMDKLDITALHSAADGVPAT